MGKKKTGLIKRKIVRWKGKYLEDLNGKLWAKSNRGKSMQYVLLYARIWVCLMNWSLKSFWELLKPCALRHSQDDSAWETSSQSKQADRFVRGKTLPASEFQGRKQWKWNLLALWIVENKNVLKENKRGFSEENRYYRELFSQGKSCRRSLMIWVVGIDNGKINTDI